MTTLKEYRKIAGNQIVDEIEEKARRLKGKHILCINSTYQGGGVAELLNSLIYLFNETGIYFGWRILHGTPDFFTVTKKFHNGLQGEQINLSQNKKDIYYETNRRFSQITHIKHDLVIVHDPQPLPLIDFYKKQQPWIFRCHIDLSKPDKQVWNYLKPFIEKYDHMVVSREDFEKDLSIPQSVIHPAIDPLTTKNKHLTPKKVEYYLKKFSINPKRPIISQVSRFDKWKDPMGVFKVYELVRKKVDCQLVMLGSLASDDPEGQTIYETVRKRADKSPYKKDINIILVDSDILVNCVQRASAVVMQKSKKEGFGLTVTEALYKGTPVVANNVGGIRLQVINGMNGFLHVPDDTKGFANSVLMLLKDKEMRERFGAFGKDHVIKNFLITRLALDWLVLFEQYLKR